MSKREQVTESARGALLRIGRRIKEGFAGEVTICVKPDGGVPWVRWVETETGDVLKSELRNPD